MNLPLIGLDQQKIDRYQGANMNIVIMSYNNAPEERVTNREAIKEALGGNAFIYVGTSDTCNQ